MNATETTALHRLSIIDPNLHKRLQITDDGCWIYGGASTNNGRGHCQVIRNGQRMQAHRRTYQILRDETLDPQPGWGSDEQLDHLCRVQKCCNPWHMDIVTTRANAAVGLNGIAGTHGSRYLGVYKTKPTYKWTAKIQYKGKPVHLGRFVTEADGGAAYDAACLLIGSPPLNLKHSIADRPPSRDELASASQRLANNGLECSSVDEALALLDAFTGTTTTATAA